MLSLKASASFVALTVAILTAQTPPAFDAATVKSNKSGTQTNISMLPNGVNFINLPLRAIIQFAYGVNQPWKLAGVPDWAATERFDINARAAGAVTTEERRLMLQALLADRFKLVAHMEKREVPIFALMMARSDAKPGEKLVQSKGCIAGNVAAPEAPSPGAGNQTCGLRNAGAGRLVLIGMPIQQLAAILGTLLGRTMVDKTGLTGRYDIDLTFVPEQPGAAGDASGPSIYTALREQLGLKLESQREVEDVLVIEHLEKQPTDN